jgi:DNA-directed RNA polymerase specialized sigma24 family protein
MLLQTCEKAPEEALAGWERLARAYWQPLYVFLRRRGMAHEAAADDVQGFFAHLLSKDFLRSIERGNGLFRSFLITSLQNWRADQNRAATAQKRGGGLTHIPLDELETAGKMPLSLEKSPEEAFDRRWARIVYDNSLATLHVKLKSRGREPQFLQLCGLLNGQGSAKYQEMATALGMSEGAVKQAALELRREFGGVLRNEIRRTVADETLVDDEVRYLIRLVRS